MMLGCWPSSRGSEWPDLSRGTYQVGIRKRRYAKLSFARKRTEIVIIWVILLRGFNLRKLQHPRAKVINLIKGALLEVRKTLPGRDGTPVKGLWCQGALITPWFGTSWEIGSKHKTMISRVNWMIMRKDTRGCPLIVSARCLWRNSGLRIFATNLITSRFKNRGSSTSSKKRDWGCI